MKSRKAEEALNSMAQLVGQIEDEGLRDTIGEQITVKIVSEMSPHEMTSVLTGHAPETLNIKHLRENVLTMLSDNQLLDMIDFLIDEYNEMKEEAGELQPEWIMERLNDLNVLLTEVRVTAAARSARTSTRSSMRPASPRSATRTRARARLSADQMLGGMIAEKDVQLSDGVDQTCLSRSASSTRWRNLYLAAGMLLKLAENFKSDSPEVRRFALRLANETLDGLDEEHGAQAVDVLYNELVEAIRREDDYQSFCNMVDAASKMAQVYMKTGRAEQAGTMLELLMSASADEAGKGDELRKYASEAVSDFLGAEGMIDAEALLPSLTPTSAGRRSGCWRAWGPRLFLAPLVDIVN